MALATTRGILSTVLIALQGCAMTNTTTVTAFRNPLTEIPAADPAFDHYIAWVPLEQAQTAGVARAMTHISLGNAGEQVAEKLCGDYRVSKQPVTDSIGPVQVQSPTAVGGYPAWYYRITQAPGPDGCAGTDSQRFRKEVKARLPVWIHIQTAAKQLE